MKKNYFLLFFSFLHFVLVAQNSQSFSRHFVSFRTGYSIPVSASQIGSPRDEVGKTYLNLEKVNGDIVDYSEKTSFGSRGAGLNFALGYGYMITPNFSAEIDFSYIHTLGIKDAYWEEKVIKKNNNGDIISENYYKAKQNSYTSMFRATPMLGVYANENLLIRPYAKFGLLIPFAGGTYVDLQIDDETGRAYNDLMPVIDPATKTNADLLIHSLVTAGILPDDFGIPTITNIKAVTTGSFSLGFVGRLGGEYKIENALGGKLKVFAEMEMQMLTVKAKQTKINSFHSTVSNNDIAALASSSGLKTVFTEEDIPEILLTTNYLNEIVETSNNSFDVNNKSYDRNKAFEQLTFRDNYNAFAFVVGLKYNF